MNQPKPKAWQAPYANQRGMTLLEILVVLAILATVTGLLFGRAISDALFESKEKTTRLQVMELANKGYVQWNLRTGKKCPDDLKALAKYTNAFSDGGDIKDAYGHDFIMLCGGKGGDLPADVRFGVQSIGDDGKRDTADDIKSWEKEKKSDE